MGTRLYPECNVETMARIASVPVAAMEQAYRYNELEDQVRVKLQIESAWADGAILDIDYDVHCYIQNHYPKIAHAYSFLLFGWGRVDHGICPDACGGTDNTSEMSEILIGHGLSEYAHLVGNGIDKLYWC
jgi:hypothetical protein